MEQDYVVLFTRNGMGHGPEALQATLTVKYLTLTLESGVVPARILLYTDGVRLACDGSPVLDLLASLEKKGCEIVLCKTCLDVFGLIQAVRVGVIGGMGDILDTLQKAEKVISL